MEHTIKFSPVGDPAIFPKMNVMEFTSPEIAKEVERRWNAHDALVEALEGFNKAPAGYNPCFCRRLPADNVHSNTCERTSAAIKLAKGE